MNPEDPGSRRPYLLQSRVAKNSPEAKLGLQWCHWPVVVFVEISGRSSLYDSMEVWLRQAREYVSL